MLLPLLSAPTRYSRGSMNTKVVPFTQPPGKPEIPSDEPMVVFTLGKQRFALRVTLFEVSRKSAEVIPIQKRCRRKHGRQK